MNPLRRLLGRPLAERLAEPEEQADALFAAAPAAILISPAGRILRANPAALALLGPVPAAAAAETLVPPTHRPALAALLRAALGGTAPEPMDATLDSGATLRLSAAPVRDAAGHIAGAWLALADTAREAGLTRQLLEAQRLQALGQLAGGVAHDFNNLLSAIRLAAEAIAEQADPASRADAAIIQETASRGADLVRRLLAFGRQQTLQPEPVEANAAVSAVAAMLGRLMGQSIRVELALEEPSRRVHVDRTQLDQVLVNLAVNARDAMPAGGTLSLRTGHTVILRPEPAFPDTIPAGRFATIEVADTGTGIPDDVLPHIFEPFFTTRRGQAGTTGGTGLGLATVHGILRQSGGYLAVQTRAGEGTTMRLYLPRWEGTATQAAPPEPQSPAEPEPQPTPAAPPPEPRCVLLVEDEDSVRTLAQRALTRRGWHVLAAPSGEEALELLESALAEGHTPAVIVSDMVMPGMDGTELLAAVRIRLARPGLPALLVSGYAAETLRQAMAEARAGFLAKPYKMDDLAARLTDLTQG